MLCDLEGLHSLYSNLGFLAVPRRNAWKMRDHTLERVHNKRPAYAWFK